MNPHAALRRVGITADDLPSMRADLLAAIKRSNNDLLHRFRGGRP